MKNEFGRNTWGRKGVGLLEHGAGSSADKKQNEKRSSHWSGDGNAGGINLGLGLFSLRGYGGFLQSRFVRSPRLRPMGFGLWRSVHSPSLRRQGVVRKLPRHAFAKNSETQHVGPFLPL